MAKKGTSFQKAAKPLGPRQRIVRRRPLYSGIREIHVPPTRVTER